MFCFSLVVSLCVLFMIHNSNTRFFVPLINVYPAHMHRCQRPEACMLEQLYFLLLVQKSCHRTRGTELRSTQLTVAVVAGLLVRVVLMITSKQYSIRGAGRLCLLDMLISIVQAMGQDCGPQVAIWTS